MQDDKRNTANETSRPRRRFGCLHLLLVALIAAAVAVVASYFVFRAVLKGKRKPCRPSSNGLVLRPWPNIRPLRNPPARSNPSPTARKALIGPSDSRKRNSMLSLPEIPIWPTSWQSTFRRTWSVPNCFCHSTRTSPSSAAKSCVSTPV